MPLRNVADLCVMDMSRTVTLMSRKRTLTCAASVVGADVRFSDILRGCKKKRFLSDFVPRNIARIEKSP